MKIMAVLAVLLAAALFIGAASAATTANVTVTLDHSDNTYVADHPIDVTFTTDNSSEPAQLNVSYAGNWYNTTPSWSNNKMTVNIPKAVEGDYAVAFSANNTSFSPESIIVTGQLPTFDRTVSQGNDAFVYEHIHIDGTNYTSQKLTKYSEGSNPTAVNQISSDPNGVFYLTEAAVNAQYGAYYYNGTSPTIGTTPQYIYIWYPELSIQAELTTATGGTAGDSIDGKTINKNTNVTFLINTPKVGPAFASETATAKVVFTTPAGGKTTKFGTTDFSGLSVAGSTQLSAPSTQPGNDAVAGTWTAQAEYVTPDYFSNYAKKSNTVSFIVQSTTLTLTASKDSVVRSNPFTVTIQGDSQMVYFVYLDGASSSDVNPTLQPDQSGMLDQNVMKVATSGNTALFEESTSKNLEKTWGYFETDASGQRVVQYNTAANTEDKTYTVKVYATDLKKDNALANTTAEIKGKDYDSVKVKVEKGAVTISASGDGSYYLGAEIKLTGTNTDSDYTFLFVTGQNLAENGISLKDLPTKVPASEVTNPVAVKTDDTWEYKWDTSKIALDTGAYTIYATSKLTNGKSSDPIESKSQYAENDKAVKLSDSEYATVSVNLKQPFVSATPSSSVIAQGDKLYVRGTAEGKPNNLMLYIFGPNFFEPYTISVEDDGSYEKKIDIGSNWASNQYFVVVQHPMYNGVFDAKLVTEQDGDVKYFTINNQTTGGASQSSFVVWGPNKLQGSQAADALTKMIDDANIDDKYTKLTFTVAAPMIRINNPGDQAVGSKFTISGTTNLAVDDQVLVDVMSSSFSPVDKTSTSTNSGISQTTNVDTTNWKLDQYTIKVNGIEVDVTTTADFNLVEKVNPTPTATATGATPTTTTTTATTTPTQTPGFGAFIALAGLGAVALLVLRRN